MSIGQSVCGVRVRRRSAYLDFGQHAGHLIALGDGGQAQDRIEHLAQLQGLKHIALAGGAQDEQLLVLVYTKIGSTDVSHTVCPARHYVGHTSFAGSLRMRTSSAWRISFEYRCPTGE